MLLVDGEVTVGTSCEQCNQRRAEIERLRAIHDASLNWLRRNANAEQHPLVRAALIEAHNAIKKIANEQNGD